MLTRAAVLNGHTDICVFPIGNEGQRYGAKPYNPQALGKHGEDFNNALIFPCNFYLFALKCM